MKTLKSILESISVKPTKVKETGSYTELWYQSLDVQLKKNHQQPLIDGYILSIERNSWDNSDKKSEIRRWKNNPMIFDNFSAYIRQFGCQPPIISVNISAYNPNDRWNSFNSSILSIIVPNPDKKEFSAGELAEFVNPIIDKLQNKTAKTIKYMANNWDLPNEYTDYNEFLKL